MQERRRTRKELAIYNLHRMFDLASQNDVPLRQMNTNNQDFQIPQELQAALSSWHTSGGSLDASRDYLGGYIHTSDSIYRLGLEPEPSGNRTVFFNWPTKAITPLRKGVAHAQ